MKEEFEGSALRELFTPVVADRGRTPAPTGAIVAAGRRRVARRRAAVAGGALAIVAAVPVAAAAIAAGPAKTDTAGTAKKPKVVAPITSPVQAGTPAGDTPARSATPSPTRTGAQSSPSSQTSSLPGSLTADPDGAAALPRTPTVLASGIMEGRHWSVAGVASGGNSAPTAKDRCLKLLISEDGHAIDPSMGDRVLYCVPGDVRGFRAEDLTDTIPNGAGTMVVGTVPAAVAKVVAHVDGITAPITTATLPAPGASAASIYIVPVPLETMAHTVFDEYDKQGVKIGSWDNSSTTSRA